MLKKSLLYFAVLAVCLASSMTGIAVASPVQWLSSDGGNDHWYDIVQIDPRSPWNYPSAILPSGGISFDQAENEANNVGGYLATPSLFGEAAFIYNTLVAPIAQGLAQIYWLGAQWNSTNGWSWVTGGPVTSWGGDTYFDYAYIPSGAGEGLTMVPNNWWTASGALQDQPLPYGFQVNGYVIEFNSEPSSTSSVPEPATLALFGVGLAGLGFTRRRKAS